MYSANDLRWIQEAVRFTAVFIFHESNALGPVYSISKVVIRSFKPSNMEEVDAPGLRFIFPIDLRMIHAYDARVPEW